jgi:hypothetical protein
MKATADQVATVLARLWAGRRLERYIPRFSDDYTQFDHHDQVPELGRQLADAFAAEGLEIGGFLRTDQGVFFAAVLERISPPIFAADEQLVVDVLTHASWLQTAGKQQQARPLAIVGAVLLLVLAVAAIASAD